MGKKKLVVLITLILCLCLFSNCAKQKEENISDQNAVDEVGEQQEDYSGEEVADAEDVEADEADEPQVSFSDADLLWSLPKGFKALDGEEGVYVPKAYPKDTSTITYIIGESDIDISTVPQDEFEQMIEDDFFDAYGDQVDVEINKYVKGTLNGRHTLRIDMEYEFKGTEYVQIEFMIYNGDESHIINFLQEKDGKWMDGFEDSIASMAFAE